MSTSDVSPVGPEATLLAATLEQLILGAWVSQAITAVAELGIADALADGPLSIGELATKVGADPDALHRILRALIGRGIFTHRPDGRYELTPLSELLRADSEISLAAVARFVGSRQHREHWSLLTEAIRTGSSVIPKLRGKSFFDYMGDDPEFGRIFDDAMTSFSEAATGPVIDAYDFTPYGTIIDIAGGHGRLLAAILASSPTTQGVLYDLPHVIVGATSLLQEKHVAGRVRLVEGSFFDRIPTGGDAYLLKNIIHDWNDDAALKILRNVRAASASGTVLLLIETVIPEDDSESRGKLVDLEMLIINGRERTASEYRQLLADAGFQMIRVVETTSSLSVIEARGV